MKSTLTLALLVVTASWCWGQIPDSPQPQPFWTPQVKALVVTDLAAKGADFYFTTVDMRPRRTCTAGYTAYLAVVREQCWTSATGVEQNPTMRPFLTHGTALRAASFLTLAAMDALVARELHKRGHGRLARAVLWLGVGQNALGAAWSAAGRK